jgi:hypothetical protein
MDHQLEKIWVRYNEIFDPILKYGDSVGVSLRMNMFSFSDPDKMGGGRRGFRGRERGRGRGRGWGGGGGVSPIRAHLY